jgi:hypothetical protein
VRPRRDTFKPVQPPLLRLDTAAGSLPGGVVGFVGQHLLFRAAAAPALLAAKLFEPGTLRLLAFLLTGFEFVQQELKGEHPIESLLARGLTLHLEAGRTVEQHYAGRHLVDILPTVAAGTNEALLDLGFAHAQRGHALRELRFLAGIGRVHDGSVTANSDAIKELVARILKSNW